MADTTFTIRIDEELRVALAEAAKARGYSEDELLQVLIQEEIHRQAETPEYDAWFRVEFEAAIREADDPNTKRIPHEEARADWLRLRAELIKRAGGESA